MRRTILAVLAALLACASTAASAAAPTAGTFALENERAKTAAYLRATQVGASQLDQHLDLWFTPIGSDRAIQKYDVDMTQNLHLIVVSYDLRTFLHVHPTLQSDGHFTIDQHLPRVTNYHIYADAEPHGFGQQVFRFELFMHGERGAPMLRTSRAATGTDETAGPYDVSISTSAFKAGVPTVMVVHIRKGNAPAADLHPYLGALAHAVFLNAGDLSYVHVHPTALADGDDMSASMPGMHMDMPALDPHATSSPDMKLNLALAKPGLYRLWLQFRGGGALYVAPFVITAT